ncbi:hypothetical protein B0H19DRAFT_1099133 [Mycena capillaripes]|nr:hypothetical protein B0H19DRAFT_1099133 [Mycena capillaripes]
MLWPFLAAVFSILCISVYFRYLGWMTSDGRFNLLSGCPSAQKPLYSFLRIFLSIFLPSASRPLVSYGLIPAVISPLILSIYV